MVSYSFLIKTFFFDQNVFMKELIYDTKKLKIQIKSQKCQICKNLITVLDMTNNERKMKI